MARRGSHTEPGSQWRFAAILMWLLAAETVTCLPWAAGAPFGKPAAAGAFKTQYPPVPTNARVQGGDLKGTYPTALERDGRPSLQPFPTLDTGPLRQLSNQSSPVPTGTQSTLVVIYSPQTSAASLVSATPSASLTSNVTATAAFSSTLSAASSVIPTPTESPNAGSTMSGQSVFGGGDIGAIPAVILSRDDHPVPKLGINNESGPIETNKFYASFFLGSQSSPAFTHPYSVAWSKGGGAVQSWGMAVSHIDTNLLALGPPQSSLPGNPVQFYVNPVGIQSMILSASELGSSTVLTTQNLTPFSAQVVLQPQAGSAQTITFPVVQGMGFITAIYSNMTPVIQSGVFYRSVVSAGSPRPGVFKYQVTLNDGSSWLVYVTPQNGSDPDLQLLSTSALTGPPGFSGTVQVAKNPAGPAGEKFYDNSSGVYALDAAVSGSVTASTGTYGLTWTKAGKDSDSTPLLMFALPHHVASFDENTQSRVVHMQLRTTTKGNATAVIGESWTFTEPELPTSMGFSPWSPSTGSMTAISSAAQQVILSAAATELGENMTQQTDLNSMYYSGKALSKFATLVYTVSVLGNDPSLAAPALESLKECYARFTSNQQMFPLVYDTVWKGVVSSASYGGDSGADFGNTYYNDHHFHYGYFIHAASIIGTLDPTWLAANQAWVNMLVRDAGNAATNDPMFPFSRMFDWYHGHSWAKGLFESFDGKDEESSSEDVMFAYALKMWGHVTGDASLEARGNLMLAILRRSLSNYFLLESNNVNQPADFIGNKVTGILFENKVDHTTYFGNALQYIQGIHMIPLLPSSGYTRSPAFVAQEWNAIFASNASTPANTVTGGWKGILYANYALVDPVGAFNFFAQPNFDYSWIDGGASRTWYLAYAAGLGGA